MKIKMVKCDAIQSNNNSKIIKEQKKMKTFKSTAWHSAVKVMQRGKIILLWN